MQPRERGFPRVPHAPTSDASWRRIMPTDEKRSIMRIELKALLLGLVCLSGIQLAQAQPSPVVSTAPGVGSGGRPENGPDVRYRIGPGDVLEVRVARAPELS